MDVPGANTSMANEICDLCNVNPRVYRCPRCGIGYCNVDCYKSEAHLECSESFYKQCAEEELKSQENDPASRQRMIEVLKRLHEEEDLNINFFDNDDEVDNEEEQLDSDDENVPDLAERLQNINLDNADDVWSALTDSERQEFEALVKNGEAEKLLPQWVPWWTCNTKKPIVELDQEIVEYMQKCPVLIDVPIFSDLKKASSNVYFNLANVIYAYAYVAHYYNGDYLNCPEEATSVFFDICDNMKTNKVHNSMESAIESVIRDIMNCQWLPQDEQTLFDFKKSAITIIQGPEETNKSFYISAALSELYRLLTTAKDNITKQKKTKQDKEFAKKFNNRNSTSLSKKTVHLCCKKLEYYLSWIKCYSANKLS